MLGLNYAKSEKLLGGWDIVGYKEHMVVGRLIINSKYTKEMLGSSTAIHTNEVSNGQDYKRLIYPSLNVYFSPRIYKDRVDHKNLPLCAYNRKVESSNVGALYDQPAPNRGDLRQFALTDGLIYQFGAMVNYSPSHLQAPSQKLKLKVLICVCMYNQGKSAINLTLNGIYENLQSLEDEGIAADEIGVVLIQDGILKLVQDKFTRAFAKGEDSMVQFYRTLDELQGKKLCNVQERINIILDQCENLSRKGMDRNTHENREFPLSIEKNISLLYQNLWKPSMTNKQCQTPDTEHYLKLFSCFKHINGTKLSSHLWFFEGFCRYLNPEFVVLLDVSTKPEKNAIANMLKGFTDNFVGGVTGFMTIDRNMKSQEDDYNQVDLKNRCCYDCLKDIFFSVEKAQQYEFIISNFFDKNAQSALGFLHVLPGAWSAYRYRALLKSDRYQPNLLQQSYFKMLLNPNIEQKDYKQANMYLAENRILPLGIYCQPDQKYYLKYVPNAVAKTDAMKSHENMLKQRRRWINSSMFAFLYVWKNFQHHASQSKHSGYDKYFTLNIAMLLSIISLVTTYFSPTLVFYVLFTTILQINVQSDFVFGVARFISTIFVCFYLIGVAGSLMGNIWIPYARYISILMAVFVFMIYGLLIYNVLGIYLSIKLQGIDFTDFSQMSILAIVITHVIIYILLLVLHLFTHPEYVCKLILNQLSYISYQGAYMMTMVIHAFCNIDDVSWGTKGSASQPSPRKYENQKIKFVGSWLFYNGLLAYFLIYIDIVIPNDTKGPNNNRRIILICLGYYSTFYFLLKALFAFSNQIKLIGKTCASCCSTPLLEGRIENVRKYWQISNYQYLKRMEMIRTDQ